MRSATEARRCSFVFLRLWLTGFQFPETLFIFTRTGEWYVISSAKKLEHLKQLQQCRKDITLLPRNNADGNAESLKIIRAAVEKAASAGGKKAEEVKKTASTHWTVGGARSFSLCFSVLSFPSL